MQRVGVRVWGGDDEVEDCVGAEGEGGEVVGGGRGFV